MTFYKVSFNFSAAGFGWSEDWISGNVSEKVLGDTVATYVDLRLACLTDNAVFTGARLSRLGDTIDVVKAVRAARLLLPGDNEYPDRGNSLTIKEFGSFGPSGDNPMEQLRSCLHMRLKYEGFRSAVRYFPGVADNVSLTLSGSLVKLQDNKWGKAWSSWRDHVIGNWRIIARTPTTVDKVYEVKKVTRLSGDPGYFGVVFPTLDTLNWAIGDKISISGFRFKPLQPKISLNGTYHIERIDKDVPSTNYYTVYLREVTTIDPATVKVFGTIRIVRKRITELELVQPVRLGVHKRGKPSLTPVGRRKTRATLDP